MVYTNELPSWPLDRQTEQRQQVLETTAVQFSYKVSAANRNDEDEVKMLKKTQQLKTQIVLILMTNLLREVLSHQCVRLSNSCVI